MDKRAFEEEMKEVATIKTCLEYDEDRREMINRINKHFRERAFRLIDIAYHWLPENVDLTKITIISHHKE